tara:strand:- start:810 stop:1511 length:702 start_codon:yes stop_codon:yes gene_type:complete
MQFFNLNETTFLVTWNQDLDSDLTKLLTLYRNIIMSICGDDIQDCVQSIRSLLIIIDNHRTSTKDIIEKIKMIDPKKINYKNKKIKVWKIPVCYDLEFAPDIKAISDLNNISIEDVIEIHSSKTYDILSMGFLPGFMYLGKTDIKIHCDRKVKPSLKIKKGSIGLALNQTCIYPSESPGGWNIIGITPIELFNLQSDSPCFSKPGDKVQFVKISKPQYISSLQNPNKPDFIEL